VTLSGGLDSSSIAALARAHLGAFTAVTFARAEEPEMPGSDLDAARRVAEALGVALEVVRPAGDELVAQLDDALVHGQDWREFNVHCALVNACLADGIAAHHARARAPGRPAVLTGDGMNELMADYTAVSYAGRDYYRLPRMAPGRLRRFLVAGLDSGDREIGVFGARGIDALQPYAICADAYARVPEAWLQVENAKQGLARDVIGGALPAFVYERPKVRAQVGSSAEVGGTLGLLADRGLDQAALAERFAALFGIEPVDLRGMIRAGFYRFPTSYPGT
jgi:asparagine synthetase B (glutamine-hydrolysing)